MKITNLRKESSERSDSLNWVKKLLENKTKYGYESIEGCNQNVDNVVTNLFERARIDMTEGNENSLEEILAAIIELESRESLLRKLNFARSFGLYLNYVLYCNENQKVFLYEIETINKITLILSFESYKEFSDWIKLIKGWSSNKSFREIDDLPFFDKELRKAGTAWPTNIDCFVSSTENMPLAIIEFQNAGRTGVLIHSNNDHFQCKLSSEKNGYYGPYISYHDDIRRWTSQEILRVQSGLRLFIITWSADNYDFQLKEIEKITIPYLKSADGTSDWNYMNKYKGALHKYVNSGRSARIEKNIAENAKTYNFYRTAENINFIINEPVLSYSNKTFPALYYTSKTKVANDSDNLVLLIEELLKI